MVLEGIFLLAKIIACETLKEQILGLNLPEYPCKLLQFGLHLTPEKLSMTLQREIDETRNDVDTILFGYGMCSRGTIGLKARNFKVVVPKVDDCVSLSLGSREEYARQLAKTPGTFYLTKGWIECGDDPYTEYLKIKEKYGQERAYFLERKIIENYTRLVFINTGGSGMSKYREYAENVAQFFGLAFEEMAGSDSLIRKLICGDWDENFVVVDPGGEVQYKMFYADTG